MSNQRNPTLACAARVAALCAAGLAAAAAGAAELKVRVLDREGRPLTDVVVAAQSGKPPQARAAAKPKTATMGQVDRQFVPRILVVETGTSVTFPNSDSVAHQVYSFSEAKRFQLSLYHGQAHPPLLFDKPGLVVLGCNIHDSMIGYIYVAPTPYFGKTDAAGTVTFADLPDSEYELSAWHPRFNEAHAQIKRTATVAGAPVTVEVRLTKPLRPDTGSRPASYDY